MLKELEESKVNIHQIFDDSREKKQLRSNEPCRRQEKIQKDPIETQMQPIEYIEPPKMEPIDKQMEPIKISLRDRLRNAL
jgi:hypothetical protein